MFEPNDHRRWRALGLCALLCSGFLRADEVYIWQRLWQAELRAQVALQAPQFDGLRVLAGQYQNAGWIEIAPDFVTLRGSKLPVIPVLRLPGSQAQLSAAQWALQIQRTSARYRQAGLNVQAIELDFDCAESQLAMYAEQVRDLRTLLKGELAINITALPAWLKSPALPGLLSAASSVTLQVHSVVAPKGGLFDPRLAEFWIRKLDQLTDKAFSVALPAYGAKLLLDAQGQVIGVEHEAELGMARASEIELSSSPESVRTLIDSLERRPVKHLRGYVWFRLPLPSDVRAWAPVTLKAVLEKAPLRAKIRSEFIQNTSGGFDVRISNSGTIPGSIPLRIAVNTRCQGEGVAEYRYSAGALSTRASTELKPGSTRIIAWLRCPDGLRPELTRR